MAAALRHPRPSVGPSDAEVAMRLQLEEAGAGGLAMSACDIASLAAVANDAAFARSLALAEAGLITGAPATGRAGGGSRNSSAGGGGGGSSGAPARRVSCGICLELVAATEMTCCGGAGCAHAYCRPCLVAHVSARVADRRYPVPCADGGCKTTLPYEVCASLVAGTGETASNLTRLHIEGTVMEWRAFCANPACATPFDFELDAAAAARAAGPAAGAAAAGAAARAGAPPPPAAAAAEPLDLYRVDCPLCATSTCVRCRVAWHGGVSCGAYQAEKDGTDALRALARAREWKACPGCGELIDKEAADCNFVLHEACGTPFCFHCGKRYKNVEATPQNLHGQADCQCGLWTYTDEGEEGEEEEEGGEIEAPRVREARVRRAPEAGACAPPRRAAIGRSPPTADGGGRVGRAVPAAALPHGYDGHGADNHSGGRGGGGGGAAAAAEPGRGGYGGGYGGGAAAATAEGGADGERPPILDTVVEVDRSRAALDLDALYEEATLGVGRRLPNGIVNDLRHATCPYPDCRREFTSRGALAAHLLATRQHDVHLCCGRPFVTAAALSQHTRYSLAGVHEYSQFIAPTVAW